MKSPKNDNKPDRQISVWEPMHRMQKMFDGILRSPFGGWMDSIDWDFPKMKTSLSMPKVNMSETKTLVKVEVEVPGCEPKDIEVEIENDVLVVHAKKEVEKEEKDQKKNYYYHESSHEAFSRAIPLPGDLQVEKATSKAKNGLLVVSIPKKKKPQVKKKHKVKVGK